MSLIISLRSEILKTKRTAAFYFTLVGAAIVPLLFLITFLSHGLPEEKQTAKDPINAIFHIASEMTSIGIFPLFVVLLCTLLPQIEFRNSTWKQVLTSPQTKVNIFIAKFLNIQFLMFFFLVVTHLLLWVVIFVAQIALPANHILSHSFDFSSVLKSSGHTYISVQAIVAIQFWIGLRLKNFIVPIAIGLVCWFTGTILVFQAQSSWSPYFPYSFHGIRFSDLFRPRLAQVEWLSAGYAVLFIVLGFLDFKRRKMGR